MIGIFETSCPKFLLLPTSRIKNNKINNEKSNAFRMVCPNFFSKFSNSNSLLEQSFSLQSFWVFYYLEKKSKNSYSVEILSVSIHWEKNNKIIEKIQLPRALSKTLFSKVCPNFEIYNCFSKNLSDPNWETLITLPKN